MITHSSSSVSSGDFAYVGRLAHDNFVGQGRLSRQFRARLCKVSKRSSCVLTNSGTAALELALHALKKYWAKRRYVVVSAYVCPAVVSAISREGLKPVFADIRADSMNLDMDSVCDIVDNQTLAVICTNIGGMPDDYAQAAALPCAVISDCAQSIGSTWDGQSLITLGHFSVMSFGPTKMLTAGTGGALLSGDMELAAKATEYAAEEWEVATYCQRGFQPTYGQHFSDLNAGLGLAQLRRLSAFISRRQKIAADYTAALIAQGKVIVPKPASTATTNHFRYYYLSDRASEWLKLLRDSAIDARPSIAHDMSKYFRGVGSLTNTRLNTGRVVSLPIYPGLNSVEICRILDVLRRGIEAGLE